VIEKCSTPVLTFASAINDIKEVNNLVSTYKEVAQLALPKKHFENSDSNSTDSEEDKDIAN
jgi:hypothetical protein